MGWSSDLCSVAVDAAVAEVLFVAGLDDSDECTTRESVTWAAASGGISTASNQPVLTVAAACTIDEIGLWAESSGGDKLADVNVDPPVVFTEAGTYTLTVMELSVS